MDQLESEKPLGTAVLVGLPHFCGFYLQEAHQVLTVKNHENYPYGNARERGIRTILKYAHLTNGIKTELQLKELEDANSI